MAKHDAFRDKTIETVEYVSGHKADVIKWGGLALGILLLIGGYWLYRDHMHTERENALNSALKVYGSQIVAPGSNPPPFTDVFFRTQPEKTVAVNKAFTELADKYGSSDESMIARYYLGIIASDNGKPGDAEKNFKIVADQGSSDYASLAKLSLSQIYQGNGKTDDAVNLLRGLTDHPTAFVSKEQASIELARLLSKTKPEEARKLLEPLRTSKRSSISQSALTALSELPSVPVPVVPDKVVPGK